MKNFILGLYCALFSFIAYTKFTTVTRHNTEFNSQDILISQLKSVKKIVTTETELSQVITYSDKKSYYFDWLTSEKKALIWVQAKAQIQYDLSKLEYTIQSDEKQIRVTHIPEPSIELYPKISYYDLQQGVFNPFTATDHNEVSQRVHKQLEESVLMSSSYKKLQDDFIESLENINLLATQLGWKFVYDIPSELLL